MNNKIEFVCNDVKDFNELRAFAEYSSELTHVISIHPSKITEIKVKFPNLLEKYVKQDINTSQNIVNIKPTVYMEKNKILIKNADIDILNYLECRGIYSPEVKVGNIPYLLDLIEDGVLEMDESFSSRLTHVDENTLVTDMLSNIGCMNFQKKRFRLSDAANIIADFQFEKYKKVTKTYFVKSNLLVIEEYNDKTKTVKFKEPDGSTLEAKYFYFTPAMANQLKVGRKVTLMCDKIKGDSNKGYITNTPKIIPSNYSKKIIKRELIMGRIPKFPNLFLNAAYSEYLYRSKIEK